MPLTGIRVLDLTRLLPGAYCTLLLADMGADVIKVEEPEMGDYMRWTPPLVDGQSVLFEALNRNKRSLTLNLKSDRDRDALLRLAGRAAVLVEGNRPGVMTRLGLGWDVLHARNRRLVVCSITGYGQDGPYASRAGIRAIACTGARTAATTASPPWSRSSGRTCVRLSAAPTWPRRSTPNRRRRSVRWSRSSRREHATSGRRRWPGSMCAASRCSTSTRSPDTRR